MDRKTLLIASWMLFLIVTIVGLVGYSSKSSDVTGAYLATRWCECKIYRLNYYKDIVGGPTFQYARVTSWQAYTDSGCNNLCQTKFSYNKEFSAVGKKTELGFNPYPLQQYYV